MKIFSSYVGFQEKAMAPDDSNIVDLAHASVSFSMVRHPFERLVSAYKDKVSPTAMMVIISSLKRLLYDANHNCYCHLLIKIR